LVAARLQPGMENTDVDRMQEELR